MLGHERTHNGAPDGRGQQAGCRFPVDLAVSRKGGCRHQGTKQHGKSIGGIGRVVGGFIGARFSSHVKAKAWAFRMLVVVILLELGHLAWHYSDPWRAAL